MYSWWIAGDSYSGTKGAIVTDIKVPELTKRNPNNWPERLILLEGQFAQIHQDHLETQKQNQYAMISLAESNERLASHFEESKRVHQRMDEHDAIVSELKDEIIRLEKTIIELKLQNQILIDFSCGVKRATWIVASGGAVVVWWFIQKWLEHPR